MKQFGISGECAEHIWEQRERDLAAYYAKYPTRWSQFKFWLCGGFWRQP